MVCMGGMGLGGWCGIHLGRVTLLVGSWLVGGRAWLGDWAWLSGWEGMVGWLGGG